MSDPRYYFEIFVYTDYEGSASHGASLFFDNVMAQVSDENDKFEFTYHDGIEIHKVWFDSDRVEVVCKIEIKMELLSC